MTPSSTASYSMVALSVSISAMTSPVLTASPSFLSHLERLPFSMVGDSAGMSMLIGIGPPQLLTRAPLRRAGGFGDGFDFVRALPGAVRPDGCVLALSLGCFRGFVRRRALRPISVPLREA